MAVLFETTTVPSGAVVTLTGRVRVGDDEATFTDRIRASAVALALVAAIVDDAAVAAVETRSDVVAAAVPAPAAASIRLMLAVAVPTVVEVGVAFAGRTALAVFVRIGDPPRATLRALAAASFSGVAGTPAAAFATIVVVDVMLGVAVTGRPLTATGRIEVGATPPAADTLVD